MALIVLLVLVMAPAAVTKTLNSQWPELLPQDCGWRALEPDHFSIPRIVGNGNTTADYGQFPWQARIVVSQGGPLGYRHQCGGVIITRLHVLTAAHCVDDVGQRSMLVRVGDWKFGRRDEAEQEFGVADFHIHKQYGVSTSLANDIALLLLKERRGFGIEFSLFVQPACLPNADTEYEPNTACEVSGWGRTADGGPLSETLRGVTVPLVSDGFCSALEVHRVRFIPGRMFCAGEVRGGPDSCQGDSGGPLVCRDSTKDQYVVFGIVSTGDPRGCGQLPGLYTKVSGFVDWLLPRLQLDLGDPGARCSCTANTGPPTTETPIDFTTDCGRFTAADGSILTTDNPDDMPWSVSLQGPNTTSLGCSGVVVSNRWILSRDDCAGPELSQTARSVPREPDGTYVEFDIARRVNYLGPYGGTSSQYLALYKTSAPIPFSNGLRPICLPDQRGQTIAAPTPGTSILFAGIVYNWDVYRWQHGDKPEVVNMTAVDAADCRYEFDDEEQYRQALVDGDAFCVRTRDRTPDEPCRVFIHDTVVMAELTTSGVRRWFTVGLDSVSRGDCNRAIPWYFIIHLRQSVEWIRSAISQN